MKNWNEYYLNGVEINLILNTKNHRWYVFFGTTHGRPLDRPDLEFTDARGRAISDFLEELKRIYREKESETAITSKDKA